MLRGFFEKFLGDVLGQSVLVTSYEPTKRLIQVRMSAQTVEMLNLMEMLETILNYFYLDIIIELLYIRSNEEIQLLIGSEEEIKNLRLEYDIEAIVLDVARV